MILRKYSVWHFSDARTGKIIKYEVTDKITGETDRPAVAEFPVTSAYTSDVQKQRAKDYADYMNRIVEATQEAYDQNLLIDKLKGTIP